MRIKKFSLCSAVAVLTLVASLTCENRVNAQVTETLVLGPNYNGDFGYSLNGYTYGGGGPIGPSSLGGVSLAYVYCIDIPDEVGVPATYTANTVTTNGTAVYGSPTLGNTFANGNNLVGVPNAGAIAWLLTTYASSATTSLQQDALQSAIWTEIYDNGTYTGTGAFVLSGGTGPGTVGALMLTYLTGVGSSPVSNFLWLSPNGVGNTPIEQALVAAYVTPEPSSFAIAALGGAGFIFYGLRRRKAKGA